MFALTILLLLAAAVLLIYLNARAEIEDEPAPDWRDDVPERWRVP